MMSGRCQKHRPAFFRRIRVGRGSGAGCLNNAGSNHDPDRRTWRTRGHWFCRYGSGAQTAHTQKIQHPVDPGHDTDDRYGGRRVRHLHHLFDHLVVHQFQGLPEFQFRRVGPVRAPVAHRPVDSFSSERLHLRRPVDGRRHGGGLPARGLHGPAHQAGRPVPLDLPLPVRHVAGRYRPRLAVDVRPQPRHPGSRPPARLDQLRVRPAGAHGDRALWRRAGRPVERRRRDHGHHAGWSPRR